MSYHIYMATITNDSDSVNKNLPATTEEKVEALADLYENEENVDTLMESLPWQVKAKIDRLPVEFQDRAPADLLTLMKDKGLKSGEALEALRDAFWSEYDHAIKEGRKIYMGNVYNGICPQRTFNYIINEPLKLAYIINPIIKYDLRLNSILRARGVEIMEDILSVSPKKMVVSYNEEGEKVEEIKIDDKLAALQMACIKQIENRTQGTPTQRSEIKQMNLNVNKEIKDEPRTMEEVQAEMDKINEELKKEQIKENKAHMYKNFINVNNLVTDLEDE